MTGNVIQMRKYRYFLKNCVYLLSSAEILLSHSDNQLTQGLFALKS